jgi:hypothetical protein
MSSCRCRRRSVQRGAQTVTDRKGYLFVAIDYAYNDHFDTITPISETTTCSNLSLIGRSWWCIRHRSTVLS